MLSSNRYETGSEVIQNAGDPCVSYHANICIHEQDAKAKVSYEIEPGESVTVDFSRMESDGESGYVDFAKLKTLIIHNRASGDISFNSPITLGMLSPLVIGPNSVRSIFEANGMEEAAPWLLLITNVGTQKGTVCVMATGTRKEV